MSQKHNATDSPSLPSPNTPETILGSPARRLSTSSPDSFNGRRRTSYFCQPPPLAHLADPRPSPPFQGSRFRPRVLSAPSFGHRVSTIELEKGRKGNVGSVSSSRCSSMDTLDTRASTALWNSVFAALHPNVNSPGEETNASEHLAMNRSVSRISMASAMSVPYDPDDPRVTGMKGEKANVELPSKRCSLIRNVSLISWKSRSRG